MTGRIGPLHLVTDEKIEPSVIVPMVDVAACAGVDVVQVRYPRLSAGELFDLVMAIRRATMDSGVKVIVSDRVDVAVAAGADGVHLGQRSLHVDDARRVVRDGMILGVSVHSIEEASEAAESGADYLTFGHVYPTSSHPGEPGRGLEAITAAVSAVAPLPVIAIGGVTAGRVPEVLAAGAGGVAVMRGILAADDIAKATKELVDAIGGR